MAAGQVAGTVRVSSFQSAFLRLVAPAVRTLADTDPGIRVEAARAGGRAGRARPCGSSTSTSSWATSTTTSRGPCTATWSATDLVRERVRLILPLDHPLARRRKVPLAELAAQPWAACQPGTGHREMQIRTCRQLGGFEPDLRYASDDFLILLELVRTTGACALLPDLVLGYEAPGVVVRDLAEGDIGRTVYLLTRTSRTPAVTVVTDALAGKAAGLR